MKDAIGLAQKIIDSGNFAIRIPYVDLAACVIFVWDYLLTLEMEVEYIWKSKWNLVKVVFVLQRYLPFFDSCYLGLYRQLGYHHSLSECRVLPFANGLISIVGIALSEGFRIYAAWARNKYIAMSLIVVGVVLFGCMFGGMYMYADALKYFDFSTVGLRRPGCFVIAAGGSNIIVMIWTSLLTWNTITMVLMSIPGYAVYRSGVKSEIWFILLKDGTYYYVYLCLLSILNITFATNLKPSLRVIITVLERTLHSTLASRVTLNMRDQVARQGEATQVIELEIHLTKVAFNDPREEENEAMRL